MSSPRIGGLFCNLARAVLEAVATEEEKRVLESFASDLTVTSEFLLISKSNRWIEF